MLHLHTVDECSFSRELMPLFSTSESKCIKDFPTTAFHTIDSLLIHSFPAIPWISSSLHLLNCPRLPSHSVLSLLFRSMWRPSGGTSAICCHLLPSLHPAAMCSWCHSLQRVSSGASQDWSGGAGVEREQESSGRCGS